MSKKKSIKSIGLRSPISQEKKRPTGLKRASSKALDP